MPNVSLQSLWIRFWSTMSAADCLTASAFNLLLNNLLSLFCCFFIFIENNVTVEYFLYFLFLPVASFAVLILHAMRYTLLTVVDLDDEDTGDDHEDSFSVSTLLANEFIIIGTYSIQIIILAPISIHTYYLLIAGKLTSILLPALRPSSTHLMYLNTLITLLIPLSLPFRNTIHQKRPQRYDVGSSLKPRISAQT